MQQYDIVLESPLGQRRGRLQWEDSGGKIRGVISLLGFDNPVTGERHGQTVFLRHELRTMLSHLSCQSELELHGRQFGGIVRSDHGTMPISGNMTGETDGPAQ